MKTKLLLLFLAICCFYSCDKIDELTEVDFNTTFTEEVVINLSDQSDAFSGTIMIDLAENPDIEPYLNKLENIKITSATYQIVSYQGDPAATGDAGVTAVGQFFGPYNHSFQQDLNSGQSFELSGADKLNELANSLQSTQQLNIVVAGTQNPAQIGSLTIRFTINTEITAQAL